ncbi:MAG TPA: hypothetical protein VEI46_05535 [Thermodesulfovibrionales bacterium]|nr:hypothetical protein [Thermodesulfovibrionales bacterium]
MIEGHFYTKTLLKRKSKANENTINCYSFKDSQKPMIRGGIFFIGVWLLLVCAACSAQIDKQKFDKVNHTVQTLQHTISVGDDYPQLGALIQQLSIEIESLNVRVTSKEERDLVQEYTKLLKMYQDGFLLWKYRAEFSSHNFVPKGRIYVGQDVEAIVVKYRLPTETHTFEPTQKTWKSIAEDSIRIIWDNADAQVKRINALLNG